MISSGAAPAAERGDAPPLALFRVFFAMFVVQLLKRRGRHFRARVVRARVAMARARRRRGGRRGARGGG
jgi:hypothetical protein